MQRISLIFKKKTIHVSSICEKIRVVKLTLIKHSARIRRCAKYALSQHLYAMLSRSSARAETSSGTHCVPRSQNGPRTQGAFY